MARPKPEGDEALIMTTLKMEKGILDRISYIAWFDRRASKKAVQEEALQSYIDKWEKKNGAITPEQIKEMEKAIGK
jgi:hypothetical protein